MPNTSQNRTYHALVTSYFNWQNNKAVKVLVFANPDRVVPNTSSEYNGFQKIGIRLIRGQYKTPCSSRVPFPR